MNDAIALDFRENMSRNGGSHPWGWCLLFNRLCNLGTLNKHKEKLLDGATF